MTMLNNTSPYAATAPGIRPAAAIFLARLGRVMNRWIAAVIAHRERQAALFALRHLSDRTSETSVSTATILVTLSRRGHGSDRACKIRGDPEASQTREAVRREQQRQTRKGQDMRIEDKRGCIDYDESGQGPTIVLVPGSCSTGVAWRPIVSQWKESFRCVTTSLLGYGGTAERRTDLDTDISHEAGILESVIRRAACPVHLVGHSFGGLTALAVALRNKVPLLSLSILEAPAPEILRHMGEHRHYGAFREMSDSYFSAFQRRKGCD